MALGVNLPTTGESPNEGSYATPTTQEKMGEVTTALAGKFGNSLPFDKIGAISKTLEEQQADVIFNSETGDPYANAPLDNYLKSSYGSPNEGAVSAAALNDAAGQRENDSDHKIKLVELVPGTNQETYTLFFEVMPSITESRTVSYEAVTPAQAPGSFQKFKSTESTQWTVNATFISRTTQEATQNLEYLNRLRGWTMPYYGDVTGNQYPERLGAPPPVLVFSGYRNHMIGPVPVVISSLNWEFPKDVDYIPAQAPSGSELIPFPTVIQIGIQLIESFSTTEFNNFSLNDFRLGNFKSAFSSTSTSSASEPILSGDSAQSVQPGPGVKTVQTQPGGGVISGAGGGRGFINPQLAVTASEEKFNQAPLTSGGGGDFGGGGATTGF